MCRNFKDDFAHVSYGPVPQSMIVFNECSMVCYLGRSLLRFACFAEASKNKASVSYKVFGALWWILKGCIEQWVNAWLRYESILVGQSFPNVRIVVEIPQVEASTPNGQVSDAVTRYSYGSPFSHTNGHESSWKNYSNSISLYVEYRVGCAPSMDNRGLVPNSIPAASTYVPPTNKELEILFQPMFDEYMEPPRVERPVSPALAVSVPVNSAGTPSSTTIDQDAHSPSHSMSSSTFQSPSLHKGVATGSTLMEDNPFAPVDNQLRETGEQGSVRTGIVIMVFGNHLCHISFPSAPSPSLSYRDVVIISKECVCNWALRDMPSEQICYVTLTGYAVRTVQVVRNTHVELYVTCRGHGDDAAQICRERELSEPRTFCSSIERVYRKLGEDPSASTRGSMAVQYQRRPVMQKKNCFLDVEIGMGESAISMRTSIEWDMSEATYQCAVRAFICIPRYIARQDLYSTVLGHLFDMSKHRVYAKDAMCLSCGVMYDISKISNTLIGGVPRVEDIDSDQGDHDTLSCCVEDCSGKLHWLYGNLQRHSVVLKEDGLKRKSKKQGLLIYSPLWTPNEGRALPIFPLNRQPRNQSLYLDVALLFSAITVLDCTNWRILDEVRDYAMVSKAVDEIVTLMKMQGSCNEAWRSFIGGPWSLSCTAEPIAIWLKHEGKKKRKTCVTINNHLGSPLSADTPPLPPAGPSRTSGASGTSRSSQLPPPPPPLSTNQRVSVKRHSCQALQRHTIHLKLWLGDY
ncbi:hypothetical protein Tco_0321520 [Tanacetum coccineum]